VIWYFESFVCKVGKSIRLCGHQGFIYRLPGFANTFNYDWTGKGQEGSFEVDSIIDGYMFEIAYKIPLNVLGTKLNKQIEP